MIEVNKLAFSNLIEQLTANTTLQERYVDGIVVPEDRIEDFVANLRQGDLFDMAALMLAVFDAAHKQLGGQVDESALRLIRSIAVMNRGRRYLEIMRAIVTAVEEGAEEGVEAARATARRAVEIAFDCTPCDHELRSRYETLLISKKTIRTTKGRSETKAGGR